jgi:hypothetical protein
MNYISKIKNFTQFVKEAISGTYDISPLGPNMPRQELKLPAGTLKDEIVWLDGYDKFYTRDDFEEIYNEYLKAGGSPLFEFTKQNLQIILQFLEEKNS